MRHWLILVVLFLSACTRQSADAGGALSANIDAVLNHQKDPRPYALEFRENYAAVCAALRGQNRPPAHCSQALGWLYNDWGAFDDAWSFLVLEKLDRFDLSGADVAKRLILLRENYVVDPHDSAAIAEEKRWADALIKKAKTGEMSVQDVRRLCRPETIGLLTAWAVASRRELTPATAKTMLAGLQSALFAICEVSSWDQFVGGMETVPEDLLVDFAVILLVIEKASLKNVLPIVNLHGASTTLSSELVDGVLSKKKTLAPMLAAYRASLSERVDRETVEGVKTEGVKP